VPVYFALLFFFYLLRADLKKDNNAVTSYNRAIKIQPSYKNAWNNQGNALCGLGKYDLALRCFSRAVELDQNYKDAWFNKALAHGYSLFSFFFSFSHFCFCEEMLGQFEGILESIFFLFLKK